MKAPVNKIQVREVEKFVDSSIHNENLKVEISENTLTNLNGNNESELNNTTETIPDSRSYTPNIERSETSNDAIAEHINKGEDAFAMNQQNINDTICGGENVQGIDMKIADLPLSDLNPK